MAVIYGRKEEEAAPKEENVEVVVTDSDGRERRILMVICMVDDVC